MILAVVPTITAVMIGGMIALPAKTATEMTATGKIAHLTAGTVPGRLLVVKKIVAPGLRPPGGRLMIEGLQGTMITGEEAMMIAEGLIILTDAGTMPTDAGTIEDATRRRNASKRGPRGTQTEMADGAVEVVLGFRTLARREKDGVCYDFSDALCWSSKNGVVYSIGVLS